MTYLTRVRTALLMLSALVLASASARAQVVVTSPTVMEHAARPGEEYTGTIEIRNTSATAQRVNVRVVDYSFQADGTNRYDEPGTRPRSNAPWLTLAARTLEIPALQQTSLRYAVRVPVGDGIRGTWSSMVMVTAAPRADPGTSAPRGRTSAGVQAQLSFGIQLATHVTGPATSRLALESLTVSPPASRNRMVSLIVRNTGERALRPMVSIELYRDNGQLVASRKAQRGLIYPGSSVHQEFDLTGVPAGTYRALIQADTGEEDVFALQVDIKL